MFLGVLLGDEKEVGFIGLSVFGCTNLDFIE
jgi:hypothetical protein